MAKTPKAINLYKGLSIYRVGGPSKWYVRVEDERLGKLCTCSETCSTIILGEFY